MQLFVVTQVFKMTGKKCCDSKEINGRVDKLSQDFNRGIAALKEEFLQFTSSLAARSGISQQVTPGDEFLNTLNLFQESINKSLNAIVSDVDKIKKSLDDVSREQVYLAMEHNRDALVLHGVIENNSPENKDLYSLVINLFQEKMGIDIKKFNIHRCYRLGKQNYATDKPRPVVVYFCQRWARQLVFGNKKRLKGTRMLITELLTTANLQLFKRARLLKKKAAWTFGGRIYVQHNGVRRMIASEADLREMAVGVSGGSKGASGFEAPSDLQVVNISNTSTEEDEVKF